MIRRCVSEFVHILLLVIVIEGFESVAAKALQPTREAPVLPPCRIALVSRRSHAILPKTMSLASRATPQAFSCNHNRSRPTVLFRSHVGNCDESARPSH